MRRAVVAVCLTLLLAVPPTLAASIDLSVRRGANPESVTLEWSSGTPSFDVFRSSGPASLLAPANRLGSTDSRFWNDTSPPGPIQFYGVTGRGAPVIDAITPWGGGYGTALTVSGSGFGTAREAVRVRFTFTDPVSGESLVVDQPVAKADGTRLELDVPMAMPNQVNQVQVIVGDVASEPVGYLVGALPDDPTPGIAGNETLAFLDRLDLLSSKFDARLDTWFLTTGTTTPEQVASFHQSLTQMRGAIAQLRAFVAAADPAQLAATDVLLSAHQLQDALAQLQRACDALSGSPLGNVMCEGQDARNVVRQIVSAMNLVNDILSAVQTAANLLCAGGVLAAIFTLGAASPLAALLCSLAGTISTIVNPIIQAISVASTAMDAIADAAPVDLVAGTYAVRVFHPLWWGDPGAVYVGAPTPVEVTPSATFENSQCAPNGCNESLSFSIWGIPFTITINVPYTQVPGLELRCYVAQSPAPDGVLPFAPLGTTNDGATCLITGADANSAAGWYRGAYAFDVTSDCGTNTVGPWTSHPYDLVTGPHLLAVNPPAAQLGDLVELVGQYMPPFVAPPSSGAEVWINGTPAVIDHATADHYFVKVPDTPVITGDADLGVDGLWTDQWPQFTVLPPVLTSVSPNPAYFGDEVVVTGTGFAAAPSNNELTIDGSPVLLLSSSPTRVSFRLNWSHWGNVVQLTAVSAHVSNTLRLDLTSWDGPFDVSLSNRKAYHPRIAVAPDGAPGIAWIDRAAAGGGARLMFTDAAQGSGTFREPVELSTDLGGIPSVPQRPALASGPDGAFHAVFVDHLGALKMSSLVVNGPAPVPVTIATPPAGTAFRDPTVAVMADGSIHVAATRYRFDGLPHDSLSQTVSVDGGATFAPFWDFRGLLFGTPFESLHLGDVDLSFAEGRLWRAYTQYCDTCAGGPLAGDAIREVFTQWSADGTTWSAPEPAGQRVADNYSYLPNSAERRHPAVSGDAGGAVVAWDAAVTRWHSAPFPYAQDYNYGTRKVAASAVPYAPAGAIELTPTAPDYQSDGSRPSIAHVTRGGAALTTIAWTERDPGNSPDFVEGIPRVKVARLDSRLGRLVAVETPTVTGWQSAENDIDDAPSVALDASGGLHLAFLRGPAGARHVMYATSSLLDYPAASAAAADPPPLAAADRQLLAVRMGSGYPVGSVEPFWGMLLIDPNDPTATRWIATSTLASAGDFAGAPTFTPDRTAVLAAGHDGFVGPTLVGLDGEARLYASDSYVSSDSFGDLRYPLMSSTGQVLGSRTRRFGRDTWATLNPAAPHLTNTHTGHAFELQQFLTSRTSTYYTAMNSDFSPEVLSFTGGFSAENPTLSSSDCIDWSPTADVLAYHHMSYGPCPSDANTTCDAIYEWPVTTNSATLRVVAAGLRGGFSYSPDGAHLAYSCGGPDCCGGMGSDTEHVICLTSGGMIPAQAGMSDTDPAWSPDGTAIAFLRQDVQTSPPGRKALMIWHAGEAQATALTGPYLGFPGWETRHSFAAIDWVTAPQQ